MEKLEKNEAPSLKRKNGIEMATPFFPKATIEKNQSVFFSKLVLGSWVKSEMESSAFPCVSKRKAFYPKLELKTKRQASR